MSFLASPSALRGQAIGLGRGFFFVILFSFSFFSPPIAAADDGSKAPSLASFVLVKEGCFEMGNPDPAAPPSERPVHQVCISDFYLGKTEVTVGQFGAFVRETGYKTEAERDDGCLLWMGKGWRKWETVLWNRPGFSQTTEHPVTCVTWNDVSEFVRWKKNKTGLPYRLPSEAEWEYAAQFSPAKEDGLKEDLDQLAWYSLNADRKTHPVATKNPNVLGLYDMAGNVWEWVSDRFDVDYYQRSVQNDPLGPLSGKGRVMRGGSWYVAESATKAHHRNWTYATKRYNSLGFRLAISTR